MFALAFTCAFVLPYATRITFTQTAALLGAAAVLQMLSVDHADASFGAILRGMGLALVLLVLAYAMRQVAALPVLGFCGVALLYVAARDYGFGRLKSMKPLAASVVLAAVVLAGLAGASGMGNRRQRRARLPGLAGLDRGFDGPLWL